MTDEKPRIKVAFLDRPVYGIGPSGGAKKVEAGVYRVADLDGVKPGIVMLKGDDEVLIAMIPEEYADQIISTTSTCDPIGWAKYRRQNPHVLSSWGEQNDRMAPGSC